MVNSTKIYCEKKSKGKKNITCSHSYNNRSISMAIYLYILCIYMCVFATFAGWLVKYNISVSRVQTNFCLGHKCGCQMASWNKFSKKLKTLPSWGISAQKTLAKLDKMSNASWAASEPARVISDPMTRG